MSEQTPYFPPPGAPGTTGEPTSGWVPPPPAGGGWVPPGMPRAAHKPGAVPLRPLRLGDFFDAGFRIVRYNPRATVGAAVLVSALTMALPLLVAAVITFTVGASIDTSSTRSELTGDDVAGLVVVFGSLVVSRIVLKVALTLVTSMVAQVTQAAAVGRRLSFGEAWAATRGRRWPMVGLVVLEMLAVLLLGALYTVLVVAVAVTAGTTATVLVVIVGFLVLIAAVWGVAIKMFYLAAPAVALEGLGVFESISRGSGLVTRQFWRILGIWLLTWLVAAVAGYVVGLPFGVAAQIGALASPGNAAVILVVAQALSTVLASAITAPFGSAVATLQYLDQRMRKEAYDVDLMAQAGLL